MRGRKPKPTYLHVIEGTLRKDRHRTPPQAQQPADRLLEPPAFMNEAQRAIWGYAIRHAPGGLLRKLDISALTAWVVACEIHQRSAKMLAEVGAAGLLYKTPTTGTLIQNPLVGVLNRQAVIMLKAAAELGFTPSSRSRVSADDNQPSDPADEFFGA